MIRFRSRRRASERTGRGLASRPALEGLERRELLFATSGGLWSHPSLITYSFAPDGTNVGGVPSALFQTMQNAGWGVSTWEQQFQKAASVWEAVANINLTEVPDNGEAVGAAGDQQGDPNVGDIRIGATPQVSGQLAFAFLPPPFNGGTDAGDIFFNSTQNWSSNGFDIETVAIHEFGHALGMSHSQISNAVMYASYEGTRQNLAPDDASGIQTVYGAVPTDGVNNSTYQTATDVTPQLNAQNQAVVVGQEMNSPSDVDWFKVTVPQTTSGTLTVTTQSTNFSLLSPKMTVYESVNGNPQGLATVSAPNSYGAAVTVTVNGVAPGQVYLFKVCSANGGSSATGASALLVNLGATPMPLAPPPTVPVASQPDQGGGSAYMDTGTGAVVGASAGGSNQGGSVQGLLGGLLNGVVGVVNAVLSAPNDDGRGDSKLGVGTLVAWGDSLTIGPGYIRRHPGVLHPHHQHPIAPGPTSATGPTTHTVVVNLGGAGAGVHVHHGPRHVHHSVS